MMYPNNDVDFLKLWSHLSRQESASSPSHLKLKDGTLTFSAVRKIMDNEIAVDYKLTIDGDKLKGKGAAEFGGEKREWDIEGKRQKNEKS